MSGNNIIFLGFEYPDFAWSIESPYTNIFYSEVESPSEASDSCSSSLLSVEAGGGNNDGNDGSGVAAGELLVLIMLMARISVITLPPLSDNTCRYEIEITESDGSGSKTTRQVRMDKDYYLDLTERGRMIPEDRR